MANVKAMLQLFHRSGVADHPLSSDYRRTMQVYLAKYGKDLNIETDAPAVCLPCPPNLFCTGNHNPAVPPAMRSSSSPNASITGHFYGVLPAAASTDKWWVPCPQTWNAHMYPRRTSVGLSSCFHVSEVWTPPAGDTQSSPFAFAFPAILLVHAENTSIITSIVNIDQHVYATRLFANSVEAPVLKKIQDTALGETVWLVQLEMDTVSAVAQFSDMLARKGDALLLALHAIDQATGAAYSTLVPLLWACAVRNSTPVQLAVPVFFIPGIVHSVLTERIVVRAVTEIMAILEIAGPPPLHIFQVASQQITTTVAALHASLEPLFFVHNNVCDAYYNPEQSLSECPTKFAATLLSSYTSTQMTAGIRLSPVEKQVRDASHTLQDILRIGSDALTESSDFMCPMNTLTARRKHVRGRLSLNIQTCAVCLDAQFWNQNQCQACDTTPDVCEAYTSQATSIPCSWTQDLLCEISTP